MYFPVHIQFPPFISKNVTLRFVHSANTTSSLPLAKDFKTSKYSQHGHIYLLTSLSKPQDAQSCYLISSGNRARDHE